MDVKGVPCRRLDRGDLAPRQSAGSLGDHNGCGIEVLAHSSMSLYLRVGQEGAEVPLVDRTECRSSHRLEIAVMISLGGWSLLWNYGRICEVHSRDNRAELEMYGIDRRQFEGISPLECDAWQHRSQQPRSMYRDSWDLY